MTTLEKLDRRIVELIHDTPYDEAIKNESQVYKEGCQAFSKICGKRDENGVFICPYCRSWGGMDRYEYAMYPNTIGRVIQAVGHIVMINNPTSISIYKYADDGEDTCGEYICEWDKKIGEESTTEDQTEETQEKLLALLS